MSKRNSNYHRVMRFRAIQKKKRIIKNLNNYWHYKFDGELCDGKIHCSCPMCSQKTKNKGKHRKSARGYYPSINYKVSDLRKLAKVSYVETDEES